MKTDKIKMDVNIAGERFSLTVPFSRQEAVRYTEAEITAIYRNWSSKFPKKSPKEILAMIAYKFASSYFDLLNDRDKDTQIASDLLDELNRLCGGNPDSIPPDVESDEFPLY